MYYHLNILYRWGFGVLGHTDYFMKIIYDYESSDLIFDHQIKSTVSKPKKIQSSEIASGKFKCK